MQPVCAWYLSEKGSSLRSQQCCFAVFKLCSFPDAKLKFPHLLFQCCFLMLAVAAAVARCTPDNCIFDWLYVSLFGEFISSPHRMCLQGDDIDDPWVATAVPCTSWQPESDVEKSGAGMRWVHAVNTLFWYLRLEDFEKIFSRLWFTFLGRCGRGLLFSSLQS